MSPSCDMEKKLKHIEDMPKRKKTNEQYHSVSIHFNHFYRNHYGEKDKRKGNIFLDDIKYEDVNDDLVGQFSTYLASEARQKCNPNKDLIGWNTIANYFSGFKNFLVSKFHDKPLPFSIESTKMARMTILMKRTKLEINRKGDKKMTGSIEASSCEDQKAIAAMCLWSGDVANAEFLHLFTSCVNNVGRGSEVSKCFIARNHVNKNIY
jgi:hypothetical protein